MPVKIGFMKHIRLRRYPRSFSPAAHRSHVVIHHSHLLRGEGERDQDSLGATIDSQACCHPLSVSDDINTVLAGVSATSVTVCPCRSRRRHMEGRVESGRSALRRTSGLHHACERRQEKAGLQRSWVFRGLPQLLARIIGEIPLRQIPARMGATHAGQCEGK